jgi:3-oxoacyl-(acyl-carrier-protein) synthase
MGASGLAEIVLGAEAMIDGFVPANAGLKNPFTQDGHFDLLTEVKEKTYTRLFKTSFGFGGRSAAVSITSETKI